MSKRVLYRAFRNADAYLDDLYHVYQSLYRLPSTRYEETLEDETLFEYCAKRKYYVLIVPYSADGHVLLERAFGNNKLSWMVIGGGVKGFLQDNFVNACQRHVSRYISQMVLGEIEPITFLENHFHFGGRTHIHYGIAFIARIRNADPHALLDQTVHSRSHFVSTKSTINSVGLDHHRRVLDLALQRIQSDRSLVVQEDEVEINATFKRRYEMHETFVKPALRMASRFCFEHSLQDLQQTIDHFILHKRCNSLLDVACGENSSSLVGISSSWMPGICMVGTPTFTMSARREPISRASRKS
jgi:hypothetical protein